MYAVERWEGLINRPNKELWIYTDHKPLIGKLTKIADNTIRGKRVKRWFNLLNQFRYKLFHIPGKEMGDADYLSRSPEYTDERLSMVEDKGNIKKIANVNSVASIFDDLSSDEKEKLLLDIHEQMSHIGYDRLIKLAREKFNAKIPVELAIIAIDKCEGCQKNRKQSLEKIPIVNIPNKFLDVVHVDLFTMKLHNENLVMLTAQDAFSKFVWVKVIKSKLSEIVLEALKEMFLPFGVPKKIVSDSGKEFKNKRIISFFESIGTNMHFTTVGRHQANGQVERFNRTIKDWAKKCLAGKEVV